MFQKSSNGESAEGIYIGSLDYDLVFQIWGRLTSLYETTRHAKTRGTIICCLAICVKHFTGLFLGSILSVPDKKESEKQEPRLAQVLDSISYFVDVIEKASLPSEQVNMRKASAEAMIASGLLEQAELIGPHVSNHRIPTETTASNSQDACDMYAYLSLETWFTCITLLEDEDDVIRHKLVTDVQKCFSSLNTGSAAREVPTQVEKGIELCFNHLSSIFGHWSQYFNYLARWVFNTASFSTPTKGGDLVRRVFDKEIDNHHEEKLLISQICCSHLENLPVSSNKDFSQSHLLQWRTRFQRQLLSFAEDHVRQQRDCWIGGVGNHKDAFLPLYGNLLGFYALSSCIFRLKTDDNNDNKSLLSDVAELGEAMNPFLRNPLISNVFWVVVRLHEECIGVGVDRSMVLSGGAGGDGEVWEGFDPYFLLR